MIGKRISSAPHCHVSAVSLIRFVDYDGNTYDRHKRRQYKQELFFPRLFHGSASCSDLFLSSPAAGGCRNVEETHLLFLRSCAKRKSVPHTSAGFLLHFLTRHIKLHFAVCICTCEENEGLQREYLFAAGFPIGARASLLAHDFASQSLVCYTFASG